MGIGHVCTGSTAALLGMGIKQAECGHSGNKGGMDIKMGLGKEQLGSRVTLLDRLHLKCVVWVLSKNSETL